LQVGYQQCQQLLRLGVLDSAIASALTRLDQHRPRAKANRLRMSNSS
jgi:hypothetical protein